MSYGSLTTFLSLSATAVLYLLSKKETAIFVTLPLLSVSQLLALTGAVLLSITIVLSGRFKFLEQWFGGMDKMYQFHHKAGVAAFVMLVHHPLLLALDALPNFQAASVYLIPGRNLAFNFGILALHSMIIMLVLTLLVRLPYHIWLMTHQFLGLSLILGFVHVILIPSDVSVYLPLRYWVLGWMAAGVAAFIYRKFLYRLVGPKTLFEVDKVIMSKNLIEIRLKPLGSFDFQPGQFGFIRVEAEDALREMHPFSFSSAPGEKTLRLSVKTTGDYTRRLRRLKKGIGVTIFGPYGMFGRNFFGDKDVIAVAGGIGVTPFLSMIEKERQSPRQRKIDFFATNRNESESYYLEELSEAERKLKNMRLYRCFTSRDSRLTAEYINNKTGGVKNKLIYLCGPQGLMLELRDQFIGMGVRPERIYFEDFSLK